MIKEYCTFPILFTNYLWGTLIKYWHIIQVLISCSVIPKQKFWVKDKNYQNIQCHKFDECVPEKCYIDQVEHDVCYNSIISQWPKQPQSQSLGHCKYSKERCRWQLVFSSNACSKHQRMSSKFRNTYFAHWAMKSSKSFQHFALRTLNVRSLQILTLLDCLLSFVSKLLWCIAACLSYGC